MSVSRQLSAISICLRESVVRITVQEVRHPGATDTAARLGTGASEFRGLSVSGASTYSTASGLIRISTVLAPTLNVPARDLQPRRVRSHCRVSPAGRFELYFCGQFSVCLFRIRGREPRSIFPLAKVGLTVQRKIYLTDFFINFYQSPPYRSY